MKFKAIIAATAVFAASIANADHHGGKAVVDGGKDVIVAEDPLGATLSTGYMTHYVFYGVEFAEDSVWVGLDYTLDALPLPVDVGAWYLNAIDNPAGYDELDLYASVAGPSLGGFDTSLTFLAYIFPETGDDETYELNLAVSRNLGVVDMHASAHYDFEIEGWYFETGVEKGFDVTDSVALVVGAGVSYQDDYFSAGGDWNHVYVQASLPIALRSNVTLEPYIAGLWALDAIEAFQDDIVHGGVSLSVSF